MRLTNRGRALVLVVLVGFAMAGLFGARSLNAVVAPALVALLASAYVMRNVDVPTVERRPPNSGFAGETRTVEYDVRASQSLPATLVDRCADGLTPVEGGLTPVEDELTPVEDELTPVEDELTSPENGLTPTEDGLPPTTDGHVAHVTLSSLTVAYEVTLDRRGVHELGPVSIAVTDPLGLVRRSFTTEVTTTLSVYPTVYELTTAGLQLELLPEGTKRRDRQEFDLLREYEHGDSLRDVHWKSTAKQPADELIVRQFTADSDAGDVLVVAESDHETADEMASAAASVAFALLATGITVGVTVADGAVPVDAGSDHRRRILDLLARTDGGSVDRDVRTAAAILITARRGDVSVVVGDRTIPFRRFLDGTQTTGATTVETVWGQRDGPESGSQAVPDGGRSP